MQHLARAGVQPLRHVGRRQQLRVVEQLGARVDAARHQLVVDAVQVDEVVVHRRLGDEAALALAAHHQALAHQLHHRLARRDARDRVARGELGLGRQAVARPVAAAGDRLAQLLRRAGGASPPGRRGAASQPRPRLPIEHVQRAGVERDLHRGALGRTRSAVRASPAPAARPPSGRRTGPRRALRTSSPLPAALRRRGARRRGGCPRVTSFFPRGLSEWADRSRVPSISGTPVLAAAPAADSSADCRGSPRRRPSPAGGTPPPACRPARCARP